jgi:hypothetical protein
VAAERDEQDVEVAGTGVVRAVLARLVGVEGASGDRHRSRVQHVDVDQPLDERLRCDDGQHHEQLRRPPAPDDHQRQQGRGRRCEQVAGRGVPQEDPAGLGQGPHADLRRGGVRGEGHGGTVATSQQSDKTDCRNREHE